MLMFLVIKMNFIYSDNNLCYSQNIWNKHRHKKFLSLNFVSVLQDTFASQLSLYLKRFTCKRNLEHLLSPSSVSGWSCKKISKNIIRILPLGKLLKKNSSAFLFSTHDSSSLVLFVSGLIPSSSPSFPLNLIFDSVAQV